MSTTIDEKVVEMRFDNKDFEKNVHTSMNTLSDLKKSLNFDGVGKSFSNLEKASKSVKFEGLSDAIETVKVKFSAFQIMAQRVLMNLVDDAYYAGKRLVRSLSFDQITAGWQKYADKTTAVQTIMAATAKDFEDTGEQMEFVNEQLDKLNWFTDETSYNFLDMVNNIGKFTSNNIKLEDAVTAMEGISTWAAISGQGVNQASSAMYNLSQALAQGYVQLIDWKSINNANMSTYEFKQNVADIAVELKKVKKVGEDLYSVGGKTYNLANLFNEGLRHKWFTSDVLIKSLKKYGDFADALNVATTEIDTTASEFLGMLDEYMKGTLNVEEAAKEAGVSVVTLSKYLQQLSADEYDVGRRAFIAAQEAKTFKEAVDAVKDAASTAWMNTFEIIFGDYLKAKKEWTALSEELYDIFVEPINERNKLLKMWGQMGGNDMLLQGIVNIWNNLKNIIGAIKDGIRDIFPPMTIKTLMSLTAGFRDLTERLMASEEILDKIRRSARGFAAVLDIVRQFAVALWGGLKQLINLIKPFGGSILDTTANIGDFLVKLRDWIKENEIFVKVVNKIINAIKLMAAGIDNLLRTLTGYGFVDLVKKLGDNLSYAYQKIYLIFKLLFGSNTPKQIVELLNRFKELTGIDLKDSKLFKFLSRAKRIIIGFKTLISDLLHGENFGDAIKKFFGASFGANLDKSFGFFGKIGEGFTKAWAKIKESFNSFKEGFNEFAEIIKARWDKIKEAFQGAKEVIVESWQKIKEVVAEVTNTDLDGMNKFAQVISVLLYPIQLFFTGLKYLFKGLGVIIENFGPSIMTFLKTVGTGFVNFAKKIGEAVKNADFNKIMEMITSGSLAIILAKLAKSLLGISKATKNLSKGKYKGILDFIMQISNSAKNVINKIGTAFAEILDSIRGVFVAWQRDLQANVLFKIASAILMLSFALVILSGIDKDDLTTAIGAITALFTELVAAFKLISSSMMVEDTLNPGKSKLSNFLTGYAQLSAFIISLAGALLIMAAAVKIIASLDKDQLKSGLLGFTIIFAELTAFLTFMGKNEIAAQVGIKGIVKFAAALYIMAMAVKKLAKLDVKSMLQGVAGLGLILMELLAFIKLLGTNLRSASMATGDLQFQSFTQMATGILIMAVAMKMLVSSVKKLGKMDPEALERGLLGFAGILAAIDAFVYLFKSPGMEEVKLMRIASMMLVMSLAMVIIASAVKIMGTMDFEHISDALIGFAGVMGILVLTFANIAGNKNTVGAAGAILMIANALLVISVAMRIMGTMDFEHMSVATLGFVGALGTMIVALQYLNGQALEILKISGAILVFALAFQVLAIAMKIMATISATDVIKSVVAMSGVFGIMSLFSAFTEGFNAIKAAASILVLAVALAALVPSLLMFKLINMGDVLTMIFALGAIVTLLGIAANTLSGAMLPLLAVSGSIALLGVGILALGVGFTALAAGLVALGGSLPVLVKFLAILAAALLEFIPRVIITFFESVLTSIINFGKAILVTLLEMLNAILPPLVELIFNFIDSILAALARHLPSITQNLIDLILDMLDVIGHNSYKIVDRLLNLAFDILEGFGEAFKNNIRRAVDVIVGLLIDVVAGAFDLLFGWFNDLIFGKTKETVANVEDLLTDEQKRLVNRVREMTQSYKELDDSRKVSVKGVDSEYGHLQELAEEYDSLIDTNGQVIKGNEDRADFILTTLANAMGIERDEIDKLIDKNGKLSKSYWDVINTMKAKAYLEANEGAYKEALANRTEAQQNYVDSINQYNEAHNKYLKISKELNEAQKEYDEDIAGPGNYQDEKAVPLFEKIEKLKSDKAEIEDTIGTLHASADSAGKLISQYETDIYRFEGMTVAIQKGNLSAMKEFQDYYENGLILAAHGNKKILDDQVRQAKADLDSYEQAFKDHVDGITEEDVEAKKYFYERALGEQAKFDMGLTKEYYSYGKEIVSEEAKGILDGKSTLVSASTDVAEATEEPIVEIPEELMDQLDPQTREMLEQYQSKADEAEAISEDLGEDIPEEIADGVKSGESKVTKAADSLGNAMIKPIQDKSKLMRGIGNDFVDGFVQGALSKESISKLEEAAIYTAAHYMSIVQQTGDSHSPSRKMAQIGTWFIQGFVNGINSLKDLVGLSARDTAQTSIDAMSETLAMASDIFGADLDVDPTIKPIMDLSDVTDGVSAINGMFRSAGTMKLAGSVSQDVRAALSDRLQNGVNVNNADVVSELGKLRGDVNALNENMSKMKVIMDTGALVGQMSSPLDISLGKQAMLKQRGV